MTMTVNIFEAKSSLSRLIASVESGAEEEIVLARNGKPAAKLVAIDAGKKQRLRLGLLEGKVRAPSLEEINASDAEILKLFGIEE